MTDQKPPFYGDPNMLMPLKESAVLSIRTRNALISDKKIYIADILQYPQKWLLRTPNFGPKGLNEVLMMLQDISDETATYELPKAIDFNILFDGNKDKIEQHYGLGNYQPKPMHGFTASDFKVASFEGDVSEESLAVTFDLPPMLGQAIKDDDMPFASPKIDITINANPDDITVQATKNTEAFLEDLSASYAETNDDATQLTIYFEMAHNGTKIDAKALTEKMAASFKKLAP